MLFRLTNNQRPYPGPKQLLDDSTQKKLVLNKLYRPQHHNNSMANFCPFVALRESLIGKGLRRPREGQGTTKVGAKERGLRKEQGREPEEPRGGWRAKVHWPQCYLHLSHYCFGDFCLCDCCHWFCSFCVVCLKTCIGCCGPWTQDPNAQSPTEQRRAQEAPRRTGEARGRLSEARGKRSGPWSQ